MSANRTISTDRLKQTMNYYKKIIMSVISLSDKEPDDNSIS